jgi:hypothetical protein
MQVVTNGFVLAGLSYSMNSPEGAAYVVRTDLSGDTVWTRTISRTYQTECSSIFPSSDGGFLLAGAIGTDAGPTDGFVCKLDQAGDTLWTTRVGGDSTDYFASVVETPTGQVVACGGTQSVSPTMQVWVVGFTPLGAAQWQQFIGSGADAAGTEIANDPVADLVFTGYNSLNQGNRDMIFTRIDQQGQFLTGYNFGNGQPADGYSIDPTSDGGYVLAGWCEGYGPGVRSFYVVKTDSTGHTANLDVEAIFDPLSIPEPFTTSASFIHPNPAQPGDPLTIHSPLGTPADLSIIDVTGHVVARFRMNDPRVPIALPDLPSGIYVAQISHRGGASMGIRFAVR